MPGAVAAIRRARAGARARVSSDRCPVSTDAPVIVDLDATLVGAHSEKKAPATFKRGFGFHPMLAFVDQAAANPGAARGRAAPGQGQCQRRRR